MTVRLNSAGIASILKSAGVRRATRRAAEAVASNVRAQGLRVGGFAGDEGDMELPVEVTETVTDRAHANVTITHPAGQAVQAKHGALTKAAAQAGLDVRSRK